MLLLMRLCYFYFYRFSGGSRNFVRNGSHFCCGWLEQGDHHFHRCIIEASSRSIRVTMRPRKRKSTRPPVAVIFYEIFLQEKRDMALVPTGSTTEVYRYFKCNCGSVFCYCIGSCNNLFCNVCWGWYFLSLSPGSFIFVIYMNNVSNYIISNFTIIESIHFVWLQSSYAASWHSA